MRAIVIAKTVSKERREYAGVRLLRLPDTENNIKDWHQEVSDISMNKLRTVLKNKLIDIINVKLQGDSIVGTNNTYRYATLILHDTGEVIGDSLYTVLYEVKTEKYKVYIATNHLGKISTFDESFILSNLYRNIKFANLMIKGSNISVTTRVPLIVNKSTPLDKGENKLTGRQLVEKSSENDVDTKETEKPAISSNLEQFKLRYEISIDDIMHGYKTKYSKYNRKITAKEIMDKQLYDVPAELVEFWNIQEFKQYMDQHGFKYRINDYVGIVGDDKFTEIDAIDKRLKVLVIPNGITKIRTIAITDVNDTPETECQLQTIYFSNSVEEVSDTILFECKHLKKFILSNDIKSMPFKWFIHRIHDSNIDYNIPFHIEKLYGLSSSPDTDFGKRLNTSTCNIDLSILPDLKSVDNCFNDIKISGIYFGTVVDISASFIRITVDQNFKVIKLGKNLAEVKGGSFSEIAIDNIDFSEASELKFIGTGSFSKLQGIRVINLSLNFKLNRIGSYTFSECTKLESIILPSSLERIGTRAFSDCNSLQNIRIPNKVINIDQYAFTNSGIKELEIPLDTSLVSIRIANATVYLNSMNRLRSNRIDCCSFKKLVIKSGLKRINNSALKNCSFEIDLPYTLEDIGDSAFFSCSLQPLLDMRGVSNLKRIGEKAFFMSNVNKIILPDGLEEIGDMAFSSCSDLYAIYIPGSVKNIGKRMFLNSGKKTAFGCTIYTQEKSDVYNYFSRGKMDIICVRDADEAYKLISEGKQISENKLTKLKMVLGSDEKHQILFTPKYENYADELFDIYRMLSNLQEYTPNLDIDGGENKIQITNILNQLGITEDNLNNSNYIADYTMYSAMLALMKSVCTNDTKILEKDCLERLKEQGYMASIKGVLATKTGDSKIISLVFTLNYIRYNLLIFTYNDSVIFCTTFKLANIDLLSWLKKEIGTDIDGNTGISPVENIMLKYNKRAFSTYRCVSKTIPRYIDVMFYKQFKRQCIVIGGRLPKNHTLTGKCTVYFYNVFTQKIIEADASYDLSNSADRDIRESTVQLAICKNIYNLKDIPQEIKDTIREHIFNMKDIKQFVEKTLDKNYLINLINKEGAYDNVKQCFEWQLSYAMQKAGIDKAEKLNKDTIKHFLNTVFFARGVKKLADIKKAKSTGTLRLSDGTEIHEFRNTTSRNSFNTSLLGGSNLYYYIVGPLDNSKSTSRIFYSNYTFLDAFILLYSMANPELPGDTLVTKEETFNEFTPLGREVSRGILAENLKLMRVYLAVSRGSGQVFLICDVILQDDKVHRYKIFRYRNLAEGVKYSCWIYGESPDNKLNFKAKRLEDDMYLLARGLAFGDIKNNSVLTARKYIIDGYPNGYELCNDEKYLFEWSAKQRKQL